MPRGCILMFLFAVSIAGCGGEDAPGSRSAIPADQPVPPTEPASGSAPETAKTISLEVYPHDAALSPDGEQIAIAAGADFGIWDLSDGQRIAGDLAPLTVTDPVGEVEYAEALDVWWTTDDTVWFRFDLGIQGYDPASGEVRATAAFPSMMGITSHDVAADGSAVFMGQGMADFFVIYDVEGDEMRRVDYSVESSSGMVGARNASFTADGRFVAVRYADGPRYFRRDGTEVEDPVSEFAGTPYEDDVAENRRFRFVAPAAESECYDDGGSITCDGDEVFTWSQQAPDDAEGRARARVVSADGSTAADVFVSASGGSIVRIYRID